jgi:ribosomal protein RSM22 (predicted rRNA methylase)
MAFDIVMASNVMNEFEGTAQALKLVDLISSSHMSDLASLVLIDPALRSASRRMMELRDLVCGSCDLRVVSPCLHERPCPMFGRARDWCHFYIDWVVPRLVKEFDEMCGTDHRHLKLSYLVLQKVKSCARAGSGLALTGIVVSSPLRSKGKMELVICLSGGSLRKVARQDKDATDKNSDMDKVLRGDIVELDNTVKIKKEDSFRKMPFSRHAVRL